MSMLDPSRESALASRLPVLRILWVAFLSSPLILGILVQTGVLPAAGEPTAPRWVSAILGAYALAVLLASLWVRFQARGWLTARRPAGVEDLLNRYLILLVLAHALAESSAIVGLVLMFLGFGLEICAGFILASLAVILLEAPRRSEAAGIIQDAARRHPDSL